MQKGRQHHDNPGCGPETTSAGTHPKRSDSSKQPKKLPEYLEAHEVEAIIRASDNPRG